MNPNLFTSRIYGYNTNNLNYQKQMKQEEMQNVVDKVLYEMNTQPNIQNSYYSTPNNDLNSLPSKPNYNNLQSNTIAKKNQKNNNIRYPKNDKNEKQSNFKFTPEFYDILKDMISKEFEKRERNSNRKSDNYKQILKRLQFYEKKIELLENEIVMLKKF